MSSRAEIERAMTGLYDARRRNDAAATVLFFSPDCRFRIMGNAALDPLTRSVAGREDLTSLLSALCAEWDFASVQTTDLWIDGDTAIARRTGPVRYIPLGRYLDTVFIDVAKFDGALIADFEEYIDTHLVAATLGESR